MIYLQILKSKYLLHSDIWHAFKKIKKCDVQYGILD
jgi:hypothetical protein